MKIFDALKIKDRKVEIPDCSRDELPEFFKQLGFTTGAEIGVYKGEYTKLFLNAGFKMYAIDPYMAYDDYDEKNRDFQARQDYLYERLKKVLNPYPNCTIIRKTSMEAVKDFDNESLDFVYIDGHHGFKYVAEDIWEWSKKVKKGGIISGHDYALAAKKNQHDPYVLHARYVIDGYVQAFRIETLYILGRHQVPEGEKRDKWRSWFWINS